MPHQNLPYEVLLRWNDGVFSGGHTIRIDAQGRLSDALPLGQDTEFPWPAVLGEINTGTLALLAEKDAQLATLAASAKDSADRLAALQTRVDERVAQVAAAHAAGDQAALNAIAADVAKPALEKRQESAQAAFDRAKAELAAATLAAAPVVS